VTAGGQFYGRSTVGTLLGIQEEVSKKRANLVSATAELEAQLARHGEVLQLLRVTNAYAESIWEKLVADPMFASPLRRLLDNGITQGAILELVKLFATMYIAALAG
jgi:hypothetical protein